MSDNLPRPKFCRNQHYIYIRQHRMCANRQEMYSETGTSDKLRIWKFYTVQPHTGACPHTRPESISTVSLNTYMRLVRLHHSLTNLHDNQNTSLAYNQSPPTTIYICHQRVLGISHSLSGHILMLETAHTRHLHRPTVSVQADTGKCQPSWLPPRMPRMKIVKAAGKNAL